MNGLLGPPGGVGRTAVATRTAGGWHEWSYSELDRHCSRVAAALGAHGVQPGERVVLAAESGGAWVAALLGIWRCGAIAVPVDPRLTRSELESILARTAPAAVIASGAAGALGPASAPGARPAGVLGLDRLVAGSTALADAPPAVPRAADDAAMVVWTSGTAGAPKGVTLSYANLAYSVGQALVVQRPSADDRWLSILPPHHLLELCCGVLPALALGATVCFARTLLPHEVAHVVAERHVTKLVAVPMLLRILERALSGSGLLTAYCGGAPLDPALADRYAAMGIPVYPGYGLTEAAPTVSMNTPEHARRASVGRPLPGTDVRIDGETGETGETGEILVRSPGVMLGYWRDEATTAGVVDAEGWLHTGDLGHLDDDGFLYVGGRAKRLVVLESGKKVHPEEIEHALAASDVFAEVCVVGVPGALAATEQVCAVVVPDAALVGRSLDAAALRHEAEAEVRRCVAPLGGYKRPTLVVVEAGPLPRTLKGSVRHDEVAGMIANRRAPKVP